MSLRHNIGGIGLDSGHIRQSQVTQKFDVAFRSLDRTEGQAQNGKSEALYKGNEIIKNHFVDLGVTNDTLLTHIILTCFKLGFD